MCLSSMSKSFSRHKSKLKSKIIIYLEHAVILALTLALILSAISSGLSPTTITIFVGFVSAIIRQLAKPDSVKERFALYLNDYKNWTYIDDEEDGYYYDKFPEFRIAISRHTCDLDRTEPLWMPESISSKPFRNQYRLLFHSTIVSDVCTYDTGDGNYELCFPEMPNNVYDFYYYHGGSINHGLTLLLKFKNIRGENYDFRKRKNAIKIIW